MTAVALTPVESSNVAAIGYDPASSELHVQFKSGQTYRYFDVPPDVHADLQHPDVSVGGYVSGNVRGRFRCELVQPPEEERDE
jgi:hypothetical protein